ncbi:beta family protein [Ancylobacter terrae]|uniref:beta family protein n=1 Tax=Ancylobacter sp. sgz301288 TaxID=3342077 RepID=UPI00385F3877
MADFDAFKYYPSLRARMWELRGYKELGGLDKDALLPLFRLTRHHRTVGVEAVAGIVEASTEGRPYIIDLELHPLLACADAATLADHTNGFEPWRRFIQERNGAVPTALLPTDAPLRSVVQQVTRMEQSFGKVVVRTQSPIADLSRLSAILSAVDSTGNVLVVLDFGYIRSRLAAVSLEVATAINTLRGVDPATRIVVMGSSYPRSAAAYSDSGTTLEIEERTLHALIGGDQIAIYGDHASIHPEPFEPMQSRFVPRVDYSLPTAWIFRRARADQRGFIRCAEQIVDLPDWDASLPEQHVWGAVKIKDASSGNIAGMGQPGPWIAVRVNLHLWQQIHFSENGDESVFG